MMRQGPHYDHNAAPYAPEEEIPETAYDAVAPEERWVEIVERQNAATQKKRQTVQRPQAGQGRAAQLRSWLTKAATEQPQSTHIFQSREPNADKDSFVAQIDFSAAKDTFTEDAAPQDATPVRDAVTARDAVTKAQAQIKRWTALGKKSFEPAKTATAAPSPVEGHEKRTFRTQRDLALRSWKQRAARHDSGMKEVLETSRTRLLLLVILMGCAFFAVGVRLIDVTLWTQSDVRRPVVGRASQAPVERAEILDRNGKLLATTLTTASLYANPKKILDPKGAAVALQGVFPDLPFADILKRLSSKKSFVWIKRNLTPRQHADVLELGLPGVNFRDEKRRVYPQGHIAAHVLGFTDIDNRGIAGLEKTFDKALGDMKEPLVLSLDVRVQHVLREELQQAMTRFEAKGAAGVMMDVTSGEIVALVSLPDFDPNKARQTPRDHLFNRATLGRYEMGSTFKIFSLAMALDHGTVDMQGGYDTKDPIRFASYVINDFHGKKRWLSVPEIFQYSSNIGTAKMMMDLGIEKQQNYLHRFGLLTPSTIEVPEVSHPAYPDPWRKISAMTVSYGHGIAVSPVQLANAVGAIVNGGVMIPASLLKRQDYGYSGTVQRVVSEQSSSDMRKLLRLSVAQGTGKKADVPGYLVGGKTGTAEKSVAGGYDEQRLLSSFVGVFPMHLPRYVVFAMLDEPKGIEETYGYATGGWVAAPVVHHVIARTAPMLGVDIVDETARDIQEDLALPPLTE